MTNLAWYLRRLSRMGLGEMVGRAEDAWRVRRWRTAPLPSANPAPTPRFSAVLPGDAVDAISPSARARILATADRLMDGHGEYFGRSRADLVNLDWSFDPSTGRHAPVDAYAFDIPFRDERAIGNIKQIWEPSRHQHLTVLATAYAISGDERYAERVADHLKSWWAANPPLRGVHWVSGIELGIRLISWVWVRRMLEGWSGAAGLFEDNPEALHHIWHHQRWLAAFASRGSSANNHVIAEAAGQLAASCAFDWFAESPSWRSDALRLFDEQLVRATFESGLNRELATEYHGLVLELGLVGALEATATGLTVADSTWRVLRHMADALASIVDAKLQPPRQGDGDDGFGLVLDGVGTNRWASLLATVSILFGELEWWPTVPRDDARTALLTRLAAAPPSVDAERRPPLRPVHLADAGMTILRDRSGGSEIWCRCDGGPHGFLSIAAHAHADALSIEVRHDGVELLVDPGTYCYHGEPEWRTYFRSTLGHNTLELDGVDQSSSGGPFLWLHHARSNVLRAPSTADHRQNWSAEHHGYRRRGRGPLHRRTVELAESTGVLRVDDEIVDSTAHRCRLAWHLGPDIELDLVDAVAHLSWRGTDRRCIGSIALPPQLSWSAHRGEKDPSVLGWYSAGFGRRIPSWTLIGSGVAEPNSMLTTVIRMGNDRSSTAESGRSN